MKHRTLAQRYADIRRVMAYYETGSADSYQSLGADTRMRVTEMLPRIAKACGNDDLAHYAQNKLTSAIRDGV
jgi:hypothetical protein